MADYNDFLKALQAEGRSRVTLDTYLPLFRATSKSEEQDGDSCALKLKEALSQLLDEGKIQYAERQRRWDKIGRVSVPYTIRIMDNDETLSTRNPEKQDPCIHRGTGGTHGSFNSEA